MSKKLSKAFLLNCDLIFYHFVFLAAQFMIICQRKSFILFYIDSLVFNRGFITICPQDCRMLAFCRH